MKNTMTKLFATAIAVIFAGTLLTSCNDTQTSTTKTDSTKVVVDTAHVDTTKTVVDTTK